jgi:hypothetical protein
MTRAWTSIPDASIDTDSPLDEALFEDLRDNDEILRQAIIDWGISETASVGTTYVTVASRSLFVPNLADITGDTRTLVVEAQFKASAGTASFKVTDNAAAVDSTEVTTGSTSYTSGEVTLNIDASLKGTIRTIDFKVKNSGASDTTSLQAIDRLTSRLNY